MNPRRLIHSLAFRFSQASRFSVCNSLGLLCIFFQLGCDFYPPPFPVSRAIILELHAANPYDQNYVDLQQQLLTLSRAGQRDEIFRVLTPRLFEASVVFHILLEKSLLWHYLAQSDSARLHAQAALNIAEFMAQVRADSFFVKRHQLLQRLMQTDASQVEHWLTANAVFIRALTLDTKDLERKQQCFNFARKQFHDLGDDKKVVDIFWLAHFFRDRKSEKAQKLQIDLARWLELSRQIGYRDGELEAFLAQAEKLGELAQFDSSLANYARAETLAERLGKTITIVNILNARAYEAMQRGELQQALALAQHGLQICAKQRFRYAEADLLEKLALIYHLKQEYATALQYVDSALTLHREVAERIDLPPLFLAQAKIYFDLGDFNAALAAADSALQDYLALEDHGGLARTFGLIGLIHARERKWQQAIANEQRGLEMLADIDTVATVIDLWTHLGELRVQIGEVEAARAAYAQALKLSLKLPSPLGQAKAFLGLGKIALLQAALDSAQVNMEKALAIAQDDSLREVLWHCHFGLAQLWEGKGDTELALQHYEFAIQELELIRNTIARLEFNMSYFSTVQEVFDRATAFALLTLQDQKLALRFMEQSRARNVLACMANTGQKSRFDFSKMKFDMQEVRNTLDDSTAVVEYRVTDEGCYLACLKRNEVKVVRLPITRVEIEALVRNLRETLGVENRKAFKRRLREDRAALIEQTERVCVEAYQQLLAPLTEQLQSLRTLYIVPDGPLFYLPFAALQREPRGPFLVETLDLAYVPSFCALKVLREKTRPFDTDRLRQALVLAMRSETIPLAVTEAFEVAHMLAGTEAKIFDRLSRDEMRTLLAQPYELIHLALHADLNDKLPFYSYLLLDEGEEVIQTTTFNVSPSPRNMSVPSLRNAQKTSERFLLVSDVLKLNLRQCELVVLSACNTALGKQISGEGMMGVTQGFLCAGAARVITSLWDVDDKSTFDLMKYFYRELTSGKQTPAHALRLAQTQLIHDLKGDLRGYPFPYFWASFVLTGTNN